MDIPSFDYSKLNWWGATSLDDLLTGIEPDYYTNDEIKKVKEYLQQPYIKSLLKINKMAIKSDLGSAEYFLNENENLASELRKFNPIVGLNFETIGMIGSCLPEGSDKSTPMQQKENEPGIWYLTVPLKKGDLKFRANNNWTMNWGGATFPNGKCLFNSQKNIQVEEGYYHVVLNLKTEEYSFEKIEK
jgi:hypothetical protein